MRQRPSSDPVFATKALRKFLTPLTANPSPVLLDLGPVVGSNVSFFGEQLGCKIFVEDIFADLDRHIRDGKLDRLPEFLKGRFPQATGSVDGVLCWDLIDYLDKPSAQAVATELTRVLRPEGALLGFFGNMQTLDIRYTKYIIVDEVNLKHRSYPAARGRQGDAAQPRHHQAVRRAARLGFVPAEEQPARDSLQKTRLTIAAEAGSHDRFNPADPSRPKPEARSLNSIS